MHCFLLGRAAWLPPCPAANGTDFSPGAEAKRDEENVRKQVLTTQLLVEGCEAPRFAASDASRRLISAAIRCASSGPLRTASVGSHSNLVTATWVCSGNLIRCARIRTLAALFCTWPRTT